MQVPDNAEGGPERDYGDNGVRGGPSHPTFIGGRKGPGAEVAIGGEHPQGQGAVQGPAGCGDASAAAGVTEQEPLELHLTVPYSYSVDAEIACLYLGPVVRALPEGVYSEITPDGKDLNILLTSESSHLLDLSVAALLHQLSTVFPVYEDFQA